MKTHYSIAIDGPSGAGKSTVAKLLASELGVTYVDTGAMYRAIGLYVDRNHCNPKIECEVKPLLSNIKLDIQFIDGNQRIFLNGEDVSDLIRSERASIYASDVSALPCVRAFLLDTQRDFARKQSVIMDGRDIGTVVLPQADLKIFLTAIPEERARRRYLEQVQKGLAVTFDDVYAQLLLRDQNDSTRATAPLKPAEDSILVDTTGLSLRESAERIKTIIKERLGS